MDYLYKTPPPNFDVSITVVTCALCYEDTVLLLQRAKRCSQGLTWCIPGGKLLEGELPLEGLVRELQEELGIVADSHRLDHQMRWFVRNGMLDYILHVYVWLLDYRPEVMLNPQEHADYIWLPFDRLDELQLVEGQKEALSAIKRPYK